LNASSTPAEIEVCVLYESGRSGWKKPTGKRLTRSILDIFATAFEVIFLLLLLSALFLPLALLAAVTHQKISR